MEEDFNDTRKYPSGQGHIERVREEAERTLFGGGAAAGRPMPLDKPMVGESPQRQRFSARKIIETRIFQLETEAQSLRALSAALPLEMSYQCEDALVRLLLEK